MNNTYKTHEIAYCSECKAPHVREVHDNAIMKPRQCRQCKDKKLNNK